MAEENNTGSELFIISDRLRSLDSEDLCDLINTLLIEKPELQQLVLEWFREKQAIMPETVTSKDLVSINENLLFEYWESARSIISEFNEYGGGPEDDEDEVYDYLFRISELIEDGDFSSATKFRFLDEAFKEYNIGNSGFEDGLMEIFFEICQTKEEWEYLVKKLDEYPSDWRKKLIMDIQRRFLEDDEAYLRERMQILSYGMDYWDLVNFYLEKNDSEKTLSTAEEGILKGEGRLTELFEFLWEYFSKKEDVSSLERIVQTALFRNKEEKNMLDRLFEYYRSRGDYEHSKAALLKSFEFTRQKHYTEYKRLKGFLNEPDWKLIEPEVLDKIKKENFHDYLQICLDKGMKEMVVESILNPPKNRFGYSIEDNFDEFADELKTDFPEKVIEYYWRKAYRNIPKGDRKTYRTAAVYLGKVKGIYLDVLNDEASWIKLFSNLKYEFRRRPAFLDEVSEL